MRIAAYYYPLSKAARAEGRNGVVELVAIEANGLTHKLTPAPAYVSGKAEARRMAQAHNATPWNF
jgi:hypothetical protein